MISVMQDSRSILLRPGTRLSIPAAAILGCFIVMNLGLANADEAASTSTERILFVCPHNAAKSIMAAGYFNSLAKERGLSARASSAGTHPIDQISTEVVALLRIDGIDVSYQKSKRLTQHDLTRADQVVSLGCEDIITSISDQSKFESWDDVPPPAQDLPGTQKSIRGHVESLISRISTKDGNLKQKLNEEDGLTN